MYRVKELTSFMKTMLIEAYDEYIQGAIEEDKYTAGWRPLSVEDFLNSDFLHIVKEKGCVIIKKGN